LSYELGLVADGLGLGCALAWLACRDDGLLVEACAAWVVGAAGAELALGGEDGGLWLRGVGPVGTSSWTAGLRCVGARCSERGAVPPVC
jgi:hypothetical protein